MRNALIFLLLLVALWTGLEVLNHGIGGAFGGAFAKAGLAAPPPTPDDTPMRRAARTVEDAYRHAEDQVSRQTE
jgi:hypothetical protein